MASTTKESICNQALSLLKITKTINDLTTDTGYVVSTCNSHIDNAIDYITERSEWNFAKVRETLSLYSNDYSTEYKYAYHKPTSPNYFLKLIKVLDNKAKEIETWEIEDKYIVCNIENIEIVFIKKITNLNLTSVSFRRVLAYYMAYLLAEPLTHSTSIVGQRLREYERVLSDAITHDAQQDKVKNRPLPNEYRFHNARF